jgi:hypothetical protein
MIEETLVRIRSKIEKADSLKQENKKELIDLLSDLQNEIQKLAATNPEVAESIVGFAQTSAHEATRAEKKDKLRSISLDALAETVAGFEDSYPRLVKIVNSICTSLSNLGI